MPGKSSNAWVTVVEDEETCVQALVLANSLRRVITTADIVVLVTKTLHEDLTTVLSQVFDAVICFDVLHQNSVYPKTLNEGKIFFWTLTMYKKCVLMDPSTVLLRNCDELFGNVSEISTLASFASNSTEAHLVILKPDFQDFLCLKHFLGSGPTAQNLPLVEVLRKTFSNAEKIQTLENGIIKMDSGHETSSMNDPAVKMWNYGSNKPWLTTEPFYDERSKDIIKFWMTIFTFDVLPAISKGKNLLTDFHSTFADFKNSPSHIPTGINKSNHNQLKDSIAIIGQSCRLPGANNVEEFWKLLESGGDGITPIPLERLQEHQTSDPRFTSIKAGFLKCPIDEFDAKFFGISPREAAFMDPQQRLMVEVAWEAIEDAAINPMTLKGSNTGVFCGVWTHEYERLLTENTTGKDFHHVVLGNAFSATSARVSYFLGLNGPNVATESGCSSSMVALHLACDSLRKRETDLALATGVNLLIDHFPHSEVSILAKDGHCKTFDEKADGFSRAEGVVVVVLKRLSDALRDDDRIISIVRGSALSNEGTTTSFGTPSKYCQELAIKDALKVAGVKPEEVDYVEAHGTGTPIGDPIEFSAISAGYKAQREKPLIIGSVKTNTGHTESAAGLVGLIKVNLAMKNEIIPPHRNLINLNPNIDLNLLPAQIPLKRVKWIKNAQRKRLAGVSSFGISGTNVHVILQEPPIRSKMVHKSIVEGDRSFHFLSLSAKTQNALKDLSQNYIAHLNNHPEMSLEDICYTANVGRQHFKHRLGLVVKDLAEVKQKLEKPSIFAETLTIENRRTVFLFTGQGSQYPSMAKTLYETHLGFRNAMNNCNDLLRKIFGISINEILFTAGKDAKLNETINSQTGIFCIEYSLLKLWESLGVKPDYVLGHSVGEFAACVAAGIMTLEEALTLLAKRSQLIHDLPPGGMLAIRTNYEGVKNLIEFFSLNNSGHWLDIAVINSQEEVVVASKQSTLKRFSQFCTDNNIKTQHLAASHAFHSRDMEAMLIEFGKAANQINFKPPGCKYVSGSTGKIICAGDIDSKYWQMHARHTVDFTKGIKSVHREGCNVFIEIGAHPILLALGMSNLPPLETQNCLWLPSIRRNEDNWSTLLNSVSKLYINGADIDWKGFESFSKRTKVSLPHYPFQRQKYWIDSKSEPKSKPLHPLLGRKVPLAVVKEHVFENVINLNDFSYLLDHQVANVVVLPGAAFLEIILAAGKEVLKDELRIDSCLVINDFVIEAPLELQEDKMCKIQIVVSEIEKSDGLLVRVFIYKNLNGYNEEKGWKVFSSAQVIINQLTEAIDNLDVAKLRCLEEISSEEFYEKTSEVGIKFGPTFQSIKKIWKGTDEMIAEIPSPINAGNMKEYNFHPIVLDAMIQSIGLSTGETSLDLCLPVGMKLFSMFSISDSKCYFAHVYKENANTIVNLFDDQSNLLCRMNDVCLVKTSIGSFMNVICAQKYQLPGLYQEVWRPRYSHLHARVEKSLLPDLEKIQCQIDEEMNKADISYDAINHCNIISDKVIGIGILITFHELGWRPKMGDKVSVRNFMSDYLLSSVHEMLIERFITILEEDGYMTPITGTGEPAWTVTKIPMPIADLNSVRDQIVNDARCFGEYSSESDITLYCQQKMCDILLGKISGVEVLFGNENRDINPLVIFTSGKSVSISNMRARYFLEYKFERIKTYGSILRILEIGAGSGGTTKEILNGLQSRGIPFRYTFTDISQVFLENAKNQFKNFSCIDYKILNIENDPKSQNFIPYSYDVIVAANVIHATESIANSISNVRQLLAPSGTLVLQEMLQPVRLVDLVYGSLEGYWKFKDFEIRTKHPCIDETLWNKVLLENGFKLSRLISKQTDRTSILIAEAGETNPIYFPITTETTQEKTAIWLIFSGLDYAISNRLKILIENSGDKAMIISDKSQFLERQDFDTQYMDYLDEEDVGKFLRSTHDSFNVKGFVLLTGLDQTNSQRNICKTFLYITKHFTNVSSIFRAMGVTRGIYCIGDQGNMFPSQSTMGGIGKSFQVERQDCKSVLIDLDPDNIDPFFESQQIFAEMWSLDEVLVSYRNNKRNVLRFVKLQTTSSPVDLPNGRYEIAIPTTNKINDITFKSPKSISLQSDEVEVCVKASALNFRDILVILKPEMYYTQFESIGTDFSGVISKVGDHVSKYKIGDEVFGISQNSSVASHVNVNGNLMLRKPKEFTFLEACTLPSVFLTAYHCLLSVAKLQSGETILIHVASGGVGLVAIQLAKSLGANIIATAGNRRKRAYLKSLGINHVFHSRDLSFGENIDKVTNGKGVDMVLNSLTGQGFKETSLKVCAKNARFIEMGKVNIWQNEDVKKLRPDVTYRIVNLETVEQSEMETLMNAMDQIVSNKRITPLPFTRFFASQIKDALNYFVKAQHIGKVVVTMPEIKESLGKQFKSDLLFSHNGTYLVTGGLGGIGLEVAKWMVKCGAKHIVLVSRGIPSEKTQQILKSLSCKEVQVLSRQVDVGDLKQLENLFATIKFEMPPLRGVIHSAGALSDGMIRNQTWQKFETVFNAKVNGGWNLHNLTKDMNLEHFVLFSSMAAMVGPLGQSNHCSANMFLDSLAFYRHSLGLPAQTINWGAWSEVGAATKTSFGNEGALGVKPFSPSQGIAALQFAMSQPIVQVGVVEINVNEFCESVPVALSYYSELLDQHDDDKGKLIAQGDQFWNEIESLNEEERSLCIKKYIEAIIRQTLKLPQSEAIDDHQTFSEIGLDSLMAVEMRNKLQQIFGKHLTLNPASLLDYPTLHGLSKYLSEMTMKVDLKTCTNVSIEIKMKTSVELALLDSILPGNIRAMGATTNPSKIKSILVTGVTGHFGPYLLKQLVEHSTTQIICLIRAKSLEHAEKRIKEKLKKFNISICLTHVTIVLGDIVEPNLGMNTAEYENLAKSVDGVFHCAVKANHIEEYNASKSGKDIRSVNVLGTIKLLEFACAFKTKRFSFVSSYTAANVFNEDGFVSDELPGQENKGEGIELGYPLTKFVCERLMNEAITRGIPCTVLRLPTLIGHSQTGHFTTDTNFIMNFVFASARLNVFVDIPGGWQSLPVDIAAKISVQLLFNDQADIGLYNVVGTERMTSDGYLKVAKEFGIPLRLVSQKEFIEMWNKDNHPLLEVFREAAKGKDLLEAIRGVSPVFKLALDGNKPIFVMSNKLLKGVQGIENEIPSPLQTMRNQLRYAIDSGIFDQMGIEYEKDL